MKKEDIIDYLESNIKTEEFISQIKNYQGLDDYVLNNRRYEIYVDLIIQYLTSDKNGVDDLCVPPPIVMNKFIEFISKNYPILEDGGMVNLDLIKEMSEDFIKQEKFKLPLTKSEKNEIMQKFNNFAKNQEELDSEFVKIVNENFWELL